MAYLGNDLQVAYQSYQIIDDISSSFNGVLTTFPLQVGGVTPVPFPINPQQCLISVNGVIQEPDPSGTSGFNLVGSNIVFSSAPTGGHAFFGVILAGADYVTVGSTFPDGSVGAPSITFRDDLDTGFYRSGSGTIGYSSNGVASPLAFLNSVQTFTAQQTFTLATVHNGGLEVDGPYEQAVETVAALDIDLSTGNYFIKTINSNSTFTFSNPPSSGTVGSFTLELTHVSGTVTWPASVKWPADTAPTLTTGKTHLFMFVTDDGGTRYRGAALVDYVN